MVKLTDMEKIETSKIYDCKRGWANKGALYYKLRVDASTDVLVRVSIPAYNYL